MRAEASVLHLDLDAFFAAVEQRDKPSLRGKPVVVGGTGGRGVVATASYEARAYGARSAMSSVEARRRCPPGTAFLGGRFNAYAITSRVVMDILGELSPLVEPVSVDEAYVDLAAGGHATDFDALTGLARDLKHRIFTATGGVRGSVGIASSKTLAKIGSELDKPDGLRIVPPGSELDVLHPLPVRALPGVGPVTGDRLAAVDVRTVGDLYAQPLTDLIALLGQAHGDQLYRLARAQDPRPVVPEREVKSVSAERTYSTDLTDLPTLEREIGVLAQRVVTRLRADGTAGRTVTLKFRRYDFTTLTRSTTLPRPVDDARTVTDLARRLLMGIDRTGGVRLLGLGVSGLVTDLQGDLFAADPVPVTDVEESVLPPVADPAPVPTVPVWQPGQDVEHTGMGRGWVWGSGLNRVTVRFEGPLTGPGPVRTFAADDPDLAPADPPDWR
ncbi:DNA polymerase IV [Nakamurella flava]|uniref:DNA polymerase IV n=1 Tax=Nakamurella flava TaxID=2576308 RepID=A0A4V6CRB0_9ACTN|nr:DNA polymerase IV [Nakamurella flava]TKV56795.1 DNA polymerase IV [Nakamurella flava]